MQTNGLYNALQFVQADTTDITMSAIKIHARHRPFQQYLLMTSVKNVSQDALQIITAN
jgi:hypothetical protein